MALAFRLLSVKGEGMVLLVVVMRAAFGASSASKKSYRASLLAGRSDRRANGMPQRLRQQGAGLLLGTPTTCKSGSFVLPMVTYLHARLS